MSENCKHMLLTRVSEEERQKHNGALKPWFKCDCGTRFFAQTNVSYVVPPGPQFATEGDEPHGFPEGQRRTPRSEF